MQNSDRSGEPSRSASFFVIGCLFFASGFSSLIYQVVWSRLLVFVFGSTTFATASVLAVFMGGLALGSFIAGKFSDRVRSPLLCYGILEGIVGLWALAVPFLLDSAIPLYKIIWQQFHIAPLMFAVLRFAVASLVLILPTACMGATLPLVSKYVAKNAQTIGSRIGTLYAVNTFGAVCGAALAGFALLPMLGLKLTTWTAAAINFALLIAVVALARKCDNTGAESPALSLQESPSKNGQAAKLAWTTLFAISAFGISGALAMAYEVGWTRALLLVIGSGTYAFTCMLTTFLVGIFLGSWLCARVIDKNKDPLLVFASLQIAAAICALAALLCYSYLPICNLVLGAFLLQSAEAAIVAKFACAAATFVPLTLCLGATFPAIVRACVKNLDSVGQSVGTLYSANTCGAILGAFLAGFLLVPFLGVEKMLLAVAVCNFLLGAAMLFVAPTARQSWRLAATVTAVCLAVAAALTPEVWDHRLLLLAQPLRRNHSDPKSIAAILFDPELRRQALSIIDVLYFADGISSNVGVVRMKDSGHSLLLTNGNVDGGDSLDMGTQILLSLFPFMVKHDIEDVCIVGYGTGVSTGTALCFPVKKVASIELEKKVYAAGNYFDHINHKPDKDPRSHFEMDDGRNFLLAANQQFDLIVSEPSNPWQAGVCNLYTREYFEICHNKLKPGGILSCWLQTTELSPAAIRSILAAVRSSFKNQLVFGTGKGPDVVILASDSPLKVDWKSIQEAFSNPAVKLQLQRSRLMSPVQVAACVKADTPSSAAICGMTAPNSDDRNYLEFTVCKTYETSNFALANQAMFDENPVQLDNVIAMDSAATGAANHDLADFAATALEMGRPNQALVWASSGKKTAPQALCIAGAAQWQLGHRQKARALWQEALANNPNDDATLVALARAAILTQDGNQAADLCRKAINANPSNSFAQYYLGLYEAAPARAISLVSDQDMRQTAFFRIANPPVVQTYLEKFIQNEELRLQYPNALYLCALAQMQSSETEQAEGLLQKYIQLQPESASGKRTLAELLWSRGKTAEAACLWAVSFDKSRPESKSLAEQAEKSIAHGQFKIAYEQLAKALELWPANYKALVSLQSIADKVPEAKQLLLLAQKTGAADAAQQAQRLFEPPNDGIAKLTELAAAGFLLWMALRKRKDEKDKQT